MTGAHEAGIPSPDRYPNMPPQPENRIPGSVLREWGLVTVESTVETKPASTEAESRHATARRERMQAAVTEAQDYLAGMLDQPIPERPGPDAAVADNLLALDAQSAAEEALRNPGAV